jgi:hypothetical protein
MKQYDMVFCIDNNPEGMINETINLVALTLNKSYKVLNEHPYSDNKYSVLYIVNDQGQTASYRAERFVTLQEWRQRQLENLLNESNMY